MKHLKRLEIIQEGLEEAAASLLTLSKALKSIRRDVKALEESIKAGTTYQAVLEQESEKQYTKADISEPQDF